MADFDPTTFFERPTEGKLIPLNHGYSTIVDCSDYDFLCGLKWYVEFRKRDRVYARTSSVKLRAYMHRFIVFGNQQNKTGVDHWNRNGLDNRRENLRICTQSQNIVNQSKRMTRNNRKMTSKYKGVYVYNNKSGNTYCWKACIMHNRKPIHIGTFNTEEDAARARDMVARDLFGEFAVLNFPDED